MNRLLCALALAGFACAAAAQSADTSAAWSFAAQDGATIAVQPRTSSALSFNDVLADTGAATTSQADSQATVGVTSAIPEPQTYALLLAGLCAIVFVAVRRRRP